MEWWVPCDVRLDVEVALDHTYTQQAHCKAGIKLISDGNHYHSVAVVQL